MFIKRAAPGLKRAYIKLWLATNFRRETLGLSLRPRMTNNRNRKGNSMIRDHLMWVLDAAFAKGEGLEAQSLMDVINDVGAEHAAWEPEESPTSIWLIVNHVSAWKDVIRRSLDGEDIVFPYKAEWPKVRNVTQQNWYRNIERLEELQARLYSHLGALSDEVLTRIIPRSGELTLAMVFQGIAAHDCYHTGQIVQMRQRQGI